jgi:hypothetical protein
LASAYQKSGLMGRINDSCRRGGKLSDHYNYIVDGCGVMSLTPQVLDAISSSFSFSGRIISQTSSSTTIVMPGLPLKATSGLLPVDVSSNASDKVSSVFFAGGGPVCLKKAYDFRACDY